MIQDLLHACSDEEAGSKLLHHSEAADDSQLRWASPDEATVVPFSRRREDALLLASDYDLCISGDGLTHLHKIGADASFVPLAQVRPHAQNSRRLSEDRIKHLTTSCPLLRVRKVMLDINHNSSICIICPKQFERISTVIGLTFIERSSSSRWLNS